MGLTSRELATIILLSLLLVLALSRNGREIVRSLAVVLRTAASWKILLVLGSYLTWAGLVIIGASRLGLWSSNLIKDTGIIVAFVGVPLVFAAVRFRGTADIVRRVLKDAIGVAALLVVYLNLVLFPIWVEIVLQALMFALVVAAAVASRDPRMASVGRTLGIVVAMIVLAQVVNVAIQVSSHRTEYDWGEQTASFALSLWLPVTLVPFVYCLAFGAASEMALMRLRWHSQARPAPARVGLALLLGFRGSLTYATTFQSPWISRVAAETSLRAALRVMKEYRESVRTNRRAEKQRLERLDLNAGLRGFDEGGLWLDRREFHDTKDVLITLYFNQMGWYRNAHRRYQAEPGRVIPEASRTDLPEGHGIQLRVRKDGKSWFGWRETIGGFCFAVGGTREVDDQWQYDGVKPPAGYPGPNAEGWRNVRTHDMSAEWAADDGPIPDA